MRTLTQARVKMIPHFASKSDPRKTAEKTTTYTLPAGQYAQYGPVPRLELVPLIPI